MIQRYIAALLILTLLGLATPARAEDYVNPNLLPKRMQLSLFTAKHTRMAGTLALAMPQSGQQPSPPSSPSGQTQAAPQPANRSLTTAGKVLKWVGIGLMAEGGLTIGIGEAVFKGNACGTASWCLFDNSNIRNIYRGIGGASMGTGFVLLLVGLSKKE